MDLYCTRCGEPWELDDVLHDAEDGEFRRSGGRILECPACEANIRSGFAEANRRRREVTAALADILGDDVDGLAAELEDLEFAGELD